MKELEDILDVYQRTPANEQVVLGTLVDLRGSGYRRPGARVLMNTSHERVGLISGGCLERDVVRQAWALTEDGPCLALYDTRGDALHPQGPYGTGCDGLVTLLLERLPPFASPEDTSRRIDPLREIAALYDAPVGASTLAMATIYGVASESSSENEDSMEIGARLVLDAEGKTRHDEVFPDKLVDMILPELKKLTGSSRSISLHVGGYTMLLEVFLPPADLLVFGDGDDVIPLVELAAVMGWRPRLVGKWPARVTRARFPRAHKLHLLEKDTLDEIPVHANTHVLVMTHDFEWDVRLLPALLESDACHIGLLGPRRRTMNLLKTMRERGKLPTPAQLERLETPVGLDLGGDAPEEVALSIISSLVARKHGRSGGKISAQQGTIHDPHERRALDAPSHEEAS